MKQQIIVILLLLGPITLNAQITIEEYRREISDLRSQIDIDEYWKKLHHLDQNVLLKAKSNSEFDSISICNMIRTSLLYETHGKKVFKTDNVVPTLNLSHNYYGESNLVFWPIILERAKVGGLIENFGGKYPAYQLESIAMSFYGYSLLNQEIIYPVLMNRLNKVVKDSVSSNLLSAFDTLKKHISLKPMNVIGKWNIQFFKNLKEDDCFEFVKMSDNHLYVKVHSRLQKLVLLESTSDFKVYRVENEPFGWSYKHSNNGGLVLLDHQNEVLIEYTLCK